MLIILIVVMIMMIIMMIIMIIIVSILIVIPLFATSGCGSPGTSPPPSGRSGRAQRPLQHFIYVLNWLYMLSYYMSLNVDNMLYSILFRHYVLPPPPKAWSQDILLPRLAEAAGTAPFEEDGNSSRLLSLSCLPTP